MNELLPIIRRKRRPLIAIDEPRVVAQPSFAEKTPDEKTEADDSISKKDAPAADVVGD